MDWNTEVETDAIDEERLAELNPTADTCNGWSFWYVENVNENAVVKDMFTIFGEEHCAVYDPDLDVTIDMTLGQFDDAPDAGAWDGDQHPYADDIEEVYEWTDKSAFEEHYDGFQSPYIV